MDKKRAGFIHVGEIIPDVLSDVEKKYLKYKKKTREEISEAFKLPKKFLKGGNK